MLKEVKNSQTFYFGKLSQIRMPSWTKGRVVLVDDTACCASSATGMGGSLAVDGAAALAGALQEHNGNFELASQDYNNNLRPFIDEVQADAISFGLETFVPRTEEAILKRNMETGADFCILLISEDGTFLVADTKAGLAGVSVQYGGEVSDRVPQLCPRTNVNAILYEVYTMVKSMSDSQFDVDVVIVGAGPVGLLLSTELALGGVSVHVLERTIEASETIKAGSINIASAEILARRGLLDKAREAHSRAVQQIAKTMSDAFGIDADEAQSTAMRKAAYAGHFAAIPLDNERLDITDPDVAGHREVVDATLVIQRDVEVLLHQYAVRLGVPIRRGTDVVRVEQQTDGVIVYTDTEKIRARYVVGCDGGRSVIRKSIGFDFPGSDPEITGRQAVVELDDASKLRFGWNSTPHGVYRYGPMPGVVLTVEFDGPPADRTSEVTASEIEESLRRTSGSDVRVTRLHGQGTRWTDNARQVSTYRIGRVLLAGDAAHVHSPFSGQGLNLGLGDVTNLGWKLAATIQGWAPEGLLDTYQTERHPVAKSVLDWTRAQVALMRPDFKVAQLRSVVAELMGTTAGMTHMITKISGVTQRVTLPGSDPLVGRLVPDTTLADGSSLRRAFVNGGFVLLDRSADSVFHAAAAGWKKRTVFLAEASTHPTTHPLAMLIRPDGVVAWTTTLGEAADPIALTRALHQWAGHPESPFV